MKVELLCCIIYHFDVQMVVTKIDKCGRGALLTNLLNLQDVVKTQTTSCFPQPFLVR